MNAEDDPQLDNDTKAVLDVFCIMFLIAFPIILLLSSNLVGAACSPVAFMAGALVVYMRRGWEKK